MTIATIEECVLYLSNRCDGAEEQDGKGFNGGDSVFGNSIADWIGDNRRLSAGQKTSCLRLIQKYRKQLLAGGLECPTEIPVPPPISANLGEYKMVVAVTNPEPNRYRIVVNGKKIEIYSPYDPELVNIIKSIEGRLFCKDPTMWTVPSKRAQELLEKVAGLNFDIDPKIGEAIEAEERKMIDVTTKKESLAMAQAAHIHSLINLLDLSAPLPVGWALRDYQVKGVQWLLAHSRDGLGPGAILADDMGCGKTVEALVAARSLQLANNGCPIFVICPVSLGQNWHKEAAYVGVEVETFSWAKLPAILEKPYILIADEAHQAQGGSKTKRGKELLALCKSPNCIAAWLLTGTPMKNGRPINLLPLLEAIDHPVARDKFAYMKRYCNFHYKQIGQKNVPDSSGSSFLAELSEKISDRLLRRTKLEVLKELPGKTRIVKPVEETRAFKAALIQVVADYKKRVSDLCEIDPEKARTLADAEALVTLGKFRETSSFHKIEETVEMARELLDSGQSVVIFTEFMSTAELLHESLGGELLTGKTKISERQALVDRFQAGESKVFIGTIKAGGVGITLTAASNLILVDRAWTPGDVEQAEDRINRMGQVNACFVYWLLMGEVDRAIDELLVQKSERIELMMRGKRKTLRGVKSPLELAKAILVAMG
jgi:SNF2 family DNA or RNA helicase